MVNPYKAMFEILFLYWLRIPSLKKTHSLFKNNNLTYDIPKNEILFLEDISHLIYLKRLTH